MGTKYILHIAVLALSPAAAFCQINTADTLKWQHRVSASGSLLEGNQSRLLLLGRYEGAQAKEQIGFSTRIDYQYGTRNSVTTENDLVTYNFVYLHPLRRLYPYLMILTENNVRRGVRFRYQFGPGISYNFIKVNKSLLRLSATGTYESTAFRDHDFNDHRDSSSNLIATARLTGRIFGRFQLIPERLLLISEYWYQQSLTETANTRLYFENTLEVPVSKLVSFRSSLRYTRESIHLAGLKAWDLFWVFGITISNF
jgi:hypothetical protein